MNNSKFYLVKCIHISLIGIYYFIIAGVLSYLIEIIIPKYDEEKYTNIPFLPFFLELLLYVILISLVVYLTRNIVDIIPSFSNHLCQDFDPSRIKEAWSGGVIIAITIFYMQVGFRQKISKFFERFMPR